MEHTRVEIYDTTLRDGAQGEGLAYSVEDKLKIARCLDDLGVAYIEGGWPGANPKDVEFFERIKSLELKNAWGAQRPFKLVPTSCQCLAECGLAVNPKPYESQAFRTRQA